MTDKDTALNFMKEVVKVKGTNTDIINKSINAVVDSEEKWNEPGFTIKLLNNTLKSEEYKEAYNKEQSKTSENTR